MKKQNGITLVALIITIIVLLILAVVAIGAVQDSDIIKHAKNATIEHENGVKTEEQLLQGYVEKIEDILPMTKEKIVSKMNADVESNPTKYTDADGVSVVATDGTRLWCSTYSFEDRPHIFWEVIYDEITSKGCLIDSIYTDTKTFTISGNSYDITYLVIEDLSAEPVDPNAEDISKYIITLPVTFEEQQTNILFDLEIVNGESYKVDNFRLAE